MLINQAYRNLWRRKRRTLITASSIGFGVWLAILTIGTRENTYQRLMAISAKSGLGSLTIATEGFLRNDFLTKRVANVAKIRHRLREMPELKGSMARIVGEAVVATSDQSTGAGFMAIDPVTDTKEYNIFNQRLVSGDNLSACQDDGALMGRLMARRLGLELGGEFIYTTTTKEGEVTSLLGSLCGIFLTGNEEIDGHFMVLPLKATRKNLGFLPTEASYLALYVKDAHKIDAVYDRLRGNWSYKEAKIFHWQQTQPDLAGFFKADQLMYRALIIFIAIIIASGIFTCMIMNIMERKRELGTMLAVGMYPVSLFLMLVIESAMLALMGFILGLCAVVPFYYYLHIYGIDLSHLVGGSWSAGGVSSNQLVLGCELSPPSLATILITLMLFTMLSSLYPALKAAATCPIKTIAED